MGHAHIKLRKGRRSIPGQAYLVTFATKARRHHFASWEAASDASRMLSAASHWQRSRLLAWVLMPDHWHGLVKLDHHDTLPALVGKLKGSSARQLQLAHPCLGRIWTPAYHDRAIRAEDRLVDAARYVVMNPVRAGIVRRVADYPFWDAVWL
jgi:REP element-mobilizing transposase RayT